MIEFAKCWCALILQPFHYQRNRNRKFFLWNGYLPVNV